MEETEVVSRVIAAASGAVQRRGKRRIVKECAQDRFGGSRLSASRIWYVVQVRGE